MKDLIIACPQCEWQHDNRPHWQCSCGHVWDTFATGGRCPRCQKDWQDTCCPTDPGGCGKWSPHLAWYRNMDEVIQEELDQIPIGLPA